jgi:hypothetical protein
MLAWKKSSRFIYNKFTSNLKILALLLMMQKITLEVKFDEIWHCTDRTCEGSGWGDGYGKEADG